MSRDNPILTARELQVLACLVLGNTNREISRELHIGESTVKFHIDGIFAKLGVSNRTEAAVVGIEAFPTLRVFAS
jgi:DNA-binding NarL/FixJ family response regulator